MTMTSGFFDSVDHDRQYTAEQFGQIMDYLINDGVYMSYPESGISYTATGEPSKAITPFKVTFTNDRDSYYNPDGPAIIIGPGRAWFDHTWTLVSTPEVIPLPTHDDAAGVRWDAVVLTMNKTAPVRRNYFRVIQGVPGADPGAGTQDPALIISTCFNQGSSQLLGGYMHNDEVHDVPIAFVRRPLGRTATDAVQTADVVSAVGKTGGCPYVRTLISDNGSDLISTQALFSTWNEEWSSFLAKTQEEANAWHQLYSDSVGSSTDGWSEEWTRFLDGRSADFMRFIKMLDRIWHVWYQGAVNWVYEYLRRIDAQEEELMGKWQDLIHDAEDLMRNGLDDYEKKIEDLLEKWEDIDNLVQTRLEELKKEMLILINDRTKNLPDQAKQAAEDKVNELLPDIIKGVVDGSKEDIFNQFSQELDVYVDNSVKKYMGEELDEMKAEIVQMKQDLYQAIQDALTTILENYANAFAQVREDITAYIKDLIATDDELSAMIKDAVEQHVENAIAGLIHDQTSGLVEQIKQEFQDQMRDVISQEVQKQLSGVYKLKGSCTFDQLPQPSADLEGGVYNVTNSFSTDERFAEGPGIEYPAGTNVSIVEKDGQWIFDVLAGSFDVSDTASKSDMDALEGRIKAMEDLTADIDSVKNLQNQIGLLREEISKLRTQLNQDFLEKD